MNDTRFLACDLSEEVYEDNRATAIKRFLAGEKPTYSKGVCDFTTCGYGRCDDFGYFEFTLWVDQLTLEVQV